MGKDRYTGMQTEMSGLLKERSSLAAELEKVKANFKEMLTRSPDNAGSANAVEIERALNETRMMLDSKNSECDAMRQDLNKRLGDSSQFRDLKALVKKKSDENKQLKLLLAQHGLAVPAAAEPTGGGIELQADSD